MPRLRPPWREVPLGRSGRPRAFGIPGEDSGNRSSTAAYVVSSFFTFSSLDFSEGFFSPSFPTFLLSDFFSAFEASSPDDTSSSFSLLAGLDWVVGPAVLAVQATFPASSPVGRE